MQRWLPIAWEVSVVLGAQGEISQPQDISWGSAQYQWETILHIYRNKNVSESGEKFLLRDLEVLDLLLLDMLALPGDQILEKVDGDVFVSG